MNTSQASAGSSGGAPKTPTSVPSQGNVHGMAFHAGVSPDAAAEEPDPDNSGLLTLPQSQDYMPADGQPHLVVPSDTLEDPAQMQLENPYEIDEKASKLSGVSGTGQSMHSRQKHKKKKKKKRAETLISEISTGGAGGRSSLSSQDSRLTGTFLLLHTLEFIALVVSVVVYVIQANKFKAELINLRNISSVSEDTCRLAPVSLQYIAMEADHDFVFNVEDSDAPALNNIAGLNKILTTLSTRLGTLVSNLNTLTTTYGPWETEDIEAYTISTTDDETGQNIAPNVIFEELQVGSLKSCLNTLAQKANNLATCTIAHNSVMGRNHPYQYPTYHNDLMYLMFNTLQPIVDGCKRAMYTYLEDTISIGYSIIVIATVVVFASIGLAALVQLFVYIYYSRSLARQRREAYYKMLDVPKNKLHAVIRRLIQSDEEDETLTHTMTETQSSGTDTTDESETEGGFDESNEDAGFEHRAHTPGSAALDSSPGTPAPSGEAASNENGPANGTSSPQPGDKSQQQMLLTPNQQTDGAAMQGGQDLLASSSQQLGSMMTGQPGDLQSQLAQQQLMSQLSPMNPQLASMVGMNGMQNMKT